MSGIFSEREEEIGPRGRETRKTRKAKRYMDINN